MSRYTLEEERAIGEAHVNAPADDFTTEQIAAFSTTVCAGCHFNQFNLAAEKCLMGCFHLCLIVDGQCIVYRETDDVQTD